MSKKRRPQREDSDTPRASAQKAALPFFSMETLGRLIVLSQLFLSAYFFSRYTFGVFEYSKVMVLWGSAAILLVLGGCIIVGRKMLPSGAHTEKLVDLLRNPLNFGVILFLLSALASTIASGAPVVSLFGANESHAGFLTVFSYVIVYFSTRAYCKTLGDAHRILYAAVLAGAVNAFYSLMQVGGADPFGGWGNVSYGSNYIRPFGCMGHPHSLSELLILTFPLAIYFAYRGIKAQSLLAAICFLISAVLSLAAIGASLARGGWGGAAVALITMAVIVFACAPKEEPKSEPAADGDTQGKPQRKLLTREALIRFTLYAGLVTLVVVPLLYALLPKGVGFEIRERVQNIFKGATRVQIWTVAWEIFKEKPIFGCGIDAFEYAFQRHRTAQYWLLEWNGTPTKAHNDILQILATQGIFGMIAVLVMLYGLGAGLVRTFRRLGAEHTLFVAALAAAFLGFFGHILVNFTVPTGGVFLAVYAGLVARLGEPAGEYEYERIQSSDPMTVFAPVFLMTMWFCVATQFSNYNEAARNIKQLHVSVALFGLFVFFGVLLVSFFFIEQHAAAAGDADVQASGAPPFLPGRSLASTPAAGLMQAVLVVFLIVFGVLMYRTIYSSLYCQRAIWIAGSAGGVAPKKALRHDMAIRLLRQSIELDPYHEMYYRNLGTNYQELANTEKGDGDRLPHHQLSEKAFAEATALVPVNAYNRAAWGMSLGNIAQDAGREIVRDAEGGARDQVKAIPVDAAARCYEEFEKSTQLDPNNLDFYKYAGQIALQIFEKNAARGMPLEKNRPNLLKAREFAQNGMKRFPNAAQMQSILALSVALDEQPEEALKLYAVLNEKEFLGPNARGEAATAYANWGTVLFKLNKYVEARGVLEKWLSIDPDDVIPTINYAQTLERLGEKDKAIAQYKRLLEFAPDNRDAKVRLRALGVPESEFPAK